MSLKLANITFDCADPIALAAFWSEVIGLPVDDGGNEFFATLGSPSAPGSPAWLFIQVPEGKTAKNRMHLDLYADDRHAEAARLVGLGASQVGEHDEFGHQWIVMNDPEGNEFCVASES
jgi:predicted enzyme related to lactoylglutathione lyase